MIASVLEFIRTQLDDFLKTQTGSNSTMVKLSGLGPTSGSSTLSIENSLTITVVNIENDNRIARNSPPLRYQQGTYRKSEPNLLDVSILIASSVNDDEYVQGLHLLSLAMEYFQDHPLFSTGLPSGLDKLPIELLSMDMDRMNGVWTALQTGYKPSVVYKLRMFQMDESGFDEGLPILTIPVVDQ